MHFDNLNKEKMTIHSDEPSDFDLLRRDAYANVLNATIVNSETPLTIGIYGSWGTGKTTLLNRTLSKLEGYDNKVKILSYNAWEHQIEKNSILSLARAITREFDLDRNNEIKKSLTVILSAFSAILIKQAGLGFNDIDKLARRYDDDYFKKQDDRAKLKEHFGKIVKTVTQDGAFRLVVAIDDLDRCNPDYATQFLEEVKLFLSQENCIYVLALDQRVILENINSRIRDKRAAELYLEKIIQVHLQIPTVITSAAPEFLAGLLPEGFRSQAEIIVRVIGGENPRKLKRFANQITLAHMIFNEIADEGGANPEKLVYVSLIESENRDLYRKIAQEPKLLLNFERKFKKRSDLKKLLAKTPALKAHVTKKRGLFENESEIKNYLLARELFSGTTIPRIPTEKEMDKIFKR